MRHLLHVMCIVTCTVLCIHVVIQDVFLIRLCSCYERYFLKSLVAEFRRTGVEESSFRNVNQWYIHVVFCDRASLSQGV